MGDVILPTVSVVVPAHNEEKFVGETLQSLHLGLCEIGLKYELIVVNDASSDNTRAVAEQMGADVLDVAYRNIAAVRNAGASRAVGEYLIFVDADTKVPKTTLVSTLAALKNGCVGGGAKVLLDNRKGISWSKYGLFLFVAFIWQKLGKWAAGCYMFCDRKLFETSGGFPEEYFAAEEYFFSRRMKQLGRFELIKQPVYTSARKLRDFSFWQLLRFITVPFLTFRGILRTRTGLEVLYEHRREDT